MTTQPDAGTPSPPSAGKDDDTNVEGRIPEKIGPREVARVVIKITGVDHLLEIEGDDVDLGTDLKVRYKHRLVAEFRRDAVDGWWYKDVVLNRESPFGGVGTAEDVGDIATDEAARDDGPAA